MITLTSKDNPQIKNAVKFKKSAKFRKQSGCFIAEGVRVCVDAYLSGAVIDAFFVTEAAKNKNPGEFEKLDGYALNTYMISPELFALISDTQTPQGFLCVIKRLDKSEEFDTIKNGGKFLALENIQDPNNLGTILRTAEAFGVSGVILTSDCCDVYNPKVVRGSMGAVFRLPMIETDSLPEFFADNTGLKTYASVVDGSAEKVTDVVFEEPCAVVIGNEGNGITQMTADSCGKKITIPMNGKAESLNASVAAAVLIWEMVK